MASSESSETQNQRLPRDPQPEDLKVMVRKEVLAEIQRERLRKEIEDELQHTSNSPLIGRIVGHPAFLVILGFILTGIIANVLKTKWDREAWNSQQSRLFIVHRIDQKYGIIDELNKEMASSNATQEAILRDIDFKKRFSKEPNQQLLNERKENAWLEARDNWQIASQVLRQKLSMYFSEPSLQSMLEQIIKDKNGLDRIMRVLIFRVENAYGGADSGVKTAFEILDTINSTHKKLVELMIKEIQKDSALDAK
jgi:hypothetical protein